MEYEHLPLPAEPDRTERHRPPGFPRVSIPSDKRAFGAALGRKLQVARERLDQDISGYDERRVLKIRLRDGEALPDLEAIPGIEILSQESKELVLTCASSAGLETLESRLATLAQDGQVTRQQVLYALEDFDRWTPDDRTGRALGTQGYPDTEPFMLDAELWPEEHADRRRDKLENFGSWLQQVQIERLDTLNQPSLVMVRLRCTKAQAERLLLNHRDVRTLDLPPRYGLSINSLLTDLNAIEPLQPPPQNAPVLTILDSGITGEHPLLKPALVEAAGFLNPSTDVTDAPDHPGHGTKVAGVGLYGDLEPLTQAGEFIPEIRLGSAKVFQDSGENMATFVEKAIEKAVEHFVNVHQCRLFNLSYGDVNKVYDGRHLRGLAYTLDRLSRDLNVLFFVSSGNHQHHQLPPADQVINRYPHYLLEDAARLLDPAPALNAVTVGGLAKFEASRQAQRQPNSIEDIPIARKEQPSPFTRSGPSINGAIKPDFVEPAGNMAVMRSGRLEERGLGVLTLHSGFASGKLFTEDIGTSFAAPALANKAVRLLRNNPGTSAHLLRALLGAHAHWPQASRDLVAPTGKSQEITKLLRLVGHGEVDESALHRSNEQCVTLIDQGTIDKDQHRFYAVPIPEAFWHGRGVRTITIAMAYTPAVRTTRLDYRATRLRFWFVLANERDEVLQAFQRGRQQGLSERETNRWLSSTSRNAGTLQVSRWEFRRRPEKRQAFVVLGRQDANWNINGEEESEPYALCATLDVRAAAESQVNLYNEIRAQLQARAQARVRV
jgi:hypothetical protein